jgi:hypothetical protein
MGPKNQGMMIPSGTTQGNFYPQGNNMALIWRNFCIDY